MINYDHSFNLHTSKAPQAIVKHIVRRYETSSVLDVGCGTGEWLNEFANCDVNHIFGIDGIGIDSRYFAIDRSFFQLIDLRNEWNLRRRYDLVLCLEVAEHLPSESSKCLVRSLCSHADIVLFSAACPNQGGQGHINCQWPSYWQERFNECGYVCEDSLRPLIWNATFPEYWYKQNIFIAKSSSELAGREPRILPYVHPQLLAGWVSAFEDQKALLEGKRGLKSAIAQSLRMNLAALGSALHRRVLQRIRSTS